MPPELLVGIETADDAAVYQLNDEQALIATTDFFMPIVDDPFDFGRIAATNAISDVYAMGGKPILALALVGMPINVLSTEVIGKILEGGESVCRAAGIPDRRRPHHRFGRADLRAGCARPGAPEARQAQRRRQARRPAGPRQAARRGRAVGGAEEGAARRDGYAQMIATTTQLNTPGPDLAALDGVHALTDVTGFGLPAMRWSWRAAPVRTSSSTGRACRCSPACASWPRRASSRARRGATGPAMAPKWGCRRTSPTRTGAADRPADQRRPAGVV